MTATSTPDAVSAELAAHLRSRTQWDELPAVFTLHRSDGQGMRMAQVPVPEWMWTTQGHPPTAVAVLAAIAVRLPRHPDGSHVLVMPDMGPLIGAAFRYEAYALTSDSPYPAVQEAARRRKAGGSTPRFENIPGRVEQRCITAVDLDGGRYMASCDRIDESKPEATEPRTHYLPDSGADGNQMTGSVVDAIVRFLDAIKPVMAGPKGRSHS